nr:MAG TPA: major capsid protein [Caudoviricetes sp.]
MPKPDFSGYATRNNIQCADGKIIARNAFIDQDGTRVPLVYMHDHNDPMNILGHADLENREDGVYCYGYLNNTPNAQVMREQIEHGDVNSLSIFANHLKHNANVITHGEIKEVSLVLAGANPGAYIENVSIQHGDYSDEFDEAIIYSDDDLDSEEEVEDETADEEEFEHDDASDDSEESDDSKDQTVAEVLDSMNQEQQSVVFALIDMAKKGIKPSDTVEHSDDGGKTVGEVFDSMTDLQRNVAYALISKAIDGDSSDSDDQTDAQNEKNSSDEAKHSDFEGADDMHTNVFEGTNANDEVDYTTLSHADMAEMIKDAEHVGSMRAYFKNMTDPDTGEVTLAHDDAHTYGIQNIDILFPDAKAIRNTPDFYKRRTEWVNGVLNGTSHVPFSRIKSMYADITKDEARAKGYTLDRNKNNRKTEEVFNVLKRTTEPQTIYKKQKLDRDDIIDITDFDVVAWLKVEMRVMFDEELARAVLIGDGRDSSSPDKIRTDRIRPIAFDDDLYTIKKTLGQKFDLTGDIQTRTAKALELVDAVTEAQVDYQGSGTPTLYAAPKMIAAMLTCRDTLNHRLWRTRADLAAELNVTNIVDVPVMETAKDSEGNPLLGIIVNLRDYTVGADKGGSISMFDDFDIDFNQQVYLMESRASGALTYPKSAIALFSPKA